MANEKDNATIKMKFTGRFKGDRKVVELPVPLISNSMKLDHTLVFLREKKNGPAFCDVPVEWAGALLELGGHWQPAIKLTADQQVAVEIAKRETDAKMKNWAVENDVVPA